MSNFCLQWSAVVIEIPAVIANTNIDKTAMTRPISIMIPIHKPMNKMESFFNECGDEYMIGRTNPQGAPQSSHSVHSSRILHFSKLIEQ